MQRIPTVENPMPKPRLSSSKRPSVPNTSNFLALPGLLQSDIKIIELEALNPMTFPTPNRPVLSIALCLLSLNTPRAHTIPRAQTPRPPPGLEAYLHSEMKQRQIPGMQVAVIQHGKIVLHEGLGLANIEHGIPVTNDTVFQINSVIKAFTGVAIMQLVESGKLDLSAPISRYLDG